MYNFQGEEGGSGLQVEGGRGEGGALDWGVVEGKGVFYWVIET